MELGLILLIATILGGATAGALIKTWSLHRRIFSLESRLEEVEGQVIREIKSRAANERWRGSGTKDRDMELLKLAKAAPAPTAQPVVWWGAKTPQ